MESGPGTAPSPTAGAGGMTINELFERRINKGAGQLLLNMAGLSNAPYFPDPSVRPWMKYRCKKTNTKIVGSVASSAPAVISGQSVTYWP